MRLSAGVLVLAITLSLVETAAAADPHGAPQPASGAYPAPAPLLLLPPCRDSFWSVLLRCAPRAEVFAPYDDVVVQNQIRGLPRAQRKPYLQLFSW